MSAPTTIEENAFHHENFQTINYLTLEGSIAQLNGKCFGGLTDLDTLELWINGSSIGSVAQGILNDVPNLSALQIQSDVNDEHLNDLLRNTTLHSLQTLSISNNNLNNLKSDALKGLTNLITINAQFSHLTSIESTILESSANKIQQVNFAYNELQNLPVDIFNIKPERSIFNVFLQQNKLETLPEGIFDMAIQSSGTVKANLINNPWRCDCDLAWLRDYIVQKKIVTDDVPECSSPQTNDGKLLIHADFSACNTTSLPSTSSTTTPEVATSSTTETVTIYPTTPSTMDNTNDSPPSTTETTTTAATSSTEETTTESSPATMETTSNTTTSTEKTTTDTTTPSTEGNYTCINPSSKYISILTETPNVPNPSIPMFGIENFTIKEDDTLKRINATIQVGNDHVLIWMKNGDTNTTDCNYTDFTAGGRRSLQMYMASFETDPDTSYIICAARKISQEITFLPLNCRAHRTQPIPQHRAWLLNKEIDSILLILVFALVVSVIVGIAASYCVVLHNPTLIKGNKRVVLMNRRTGEIIMVMPEGYSHTGTRHPLQTSYDTASNSEASLLTATGLTTVEQTAWQFRQRCNQPRGNCRPASATAFTPQQEPPPLPLHRRSSASDTSSYTAPISEPSYATVTKPKIVLLMVDNSTIV